MTSSTTAEQAPFDLFTGELVRLTAPRPEDSALLAKWTSRGDYLTRVDTDLAVPRSPSDFDQPPAKVGNLVEFRVRRVQDDTLVGFAALFGIEWNNRAAMIATGIADPAARRRGYGAESLQLLLRFAFDEMNLDRVGLQVIASNSEAIRLYERAGFVKEGVLRRVVLRRGQRIDVIAMGMLREEWKWMPRR